MIFFFSKSFSMWISTDTHTFSFAGMFLSLSYILRNCVSGKWVNKVGDLKPCTEKLNIMNLKDVKKKLPQTLWVWLWRWR